MARIVMIATAALFAILSLSAQDAAGQPEEILLQEGTNGSAVVLLTIARLQQTGIFADDNELLRRIAYVETRDGTAAQTFRQGYDGGIWAVDQNVFLDTQNVDTRPRLRVKLAQLQDEFSINWEKTNWRDLRRPLYSAIAARLVLYNFPRAIPKANDISAQAELWADHYRQGGSPSEFEVIANELEGSVLESTANEFYVGFMYTLDQPPTLQLFVSTPEPNPVNFSVTTQVGFTFNGTATRQSTTTVILPSTLQVQTNTERNKGIYIKAEENKRILVYGLNYREFTSDAFLALPCDRYAVNQYEYYALTYHGVSSPASTILIVACEDNTTITTPSATVQLNRQQTYLIREFRDLSGTKIVSTKPISFFPGHECTDIPTGVGACDHLTEQVPPTNTWGNSFLGASFLGKSSGAIYRVLSAHNSTTVIVNCTTMVQPITYALSAAGSWEEFQALENSFCSIESNNPVLVMEYAQGFNLDGVGDPFMTMIPPVEQYSNNYVLNVLPEFNTNYLTIYVAPEFFQPERLFVDNSSLISANWTAVYCSSGTICGYITRENLTAGEHRLYHQDAAARVGVSAYGFNRFNSYGYPGGLQLIPVQLATVSFSAATYSIEENTGTITVPVIRGGDTERLAVVLVAADIFQGSASAGQDYNPVTQILEFQPGETQKNITIIINNDQRIEAAEQFELYLAGGIGVHLSPFSRTAITITNDDGIITLSPDYGSMLGGSSVLVSGPRFTVQEEDNITCMFDDTGVNGIFISNQQVLCVSPPLSNTGRVPFRLLMAGETEFVAQSVFVSLSFMKAYEVYIESDDLFFASGTSIVVNWSPQTILPLAPPESYSVDIELMELNVTSGVWKCLVGLETNLDNNGFAEVKIPDINTVDDFSNSVSPVVVQVSVSSASTSTPRGIMSDLLANLGRFSLRTLKTSPVRYLSKLSRQAVQRSHCETWGRNEPDNIGQEILNRLPPCPPTAASARAQNSGFKEERLASLIPVVGKVQNFFNTAIIDDDFREFLHPMTSSCFQQIITDRSQTGGSGQQCCYDDRGRLIIGPPGGGTVELVSADVSFERNFIRDVIPFLLCCKAGIFSNCGEYYEHRPSDNGARFDPPTPAGLRGDPHIVTLDGLQYTFNGKGEFALIGTPDDSFTLQGRMIPAVDTNGSAVLATVFSAIVGKQGDSDSIQFELTENGTTAFVNNEPVDFSVLSEQEFNNVTVSDLGNSTLSATFSSGAYLEVKEENGIISVVIVSLPEHFKDVPTHGLMGSFNGNTSDDLLPRLGTNPLPLNSSLQEIHELFGLTWIIDTPVESCFTYQPGESWATYYDPYFVPTYLTQFSDLDLAAQANELCGNDLFCLFDIAATGRVDIGLSTLQGSQELEQIVQLSLPVVCSPPCENGACVANDTCNCAAGYQGERCTDPVVVTICSVIEPLMVSPFQNLNSYNFRGTCEHVLLSSCNRTVNFRITVDFLANTLDNSRIGALYEGGMYISREDGTFEVDSDTRIISSSGSTTVYERNVTVTRTSRRTTINFQDLGVTIIHRFASPGQDPSFQVTISNTSVLGQTCGLCGTTDGILLFSDGTTTANFMNMTEVNAFANSYLVEPRNQFLHTQRRECGQVTNDTVVGDPLFTVPIASTGQSLCYEVHGMANRIFNLVSDECTTVNAHYAPMNIPENGNIISRIGVRAVPNSGFCKNVRVELDGCRAFIDGTEVIGLREEQGVEVRRMRSRVRISVPNCDNLRLVMWVMCQNISGQTMLRFVITRGLNLRPTSHGLIGQFWNTPVVATQFTGTIDRSSDGLDLDQLYVVTVTPQDGAPQRSFLAERYVRTWENRPGPCLYAGNAQAGWSREVDALRDPVIQGRYSDYRVDGLFGTAFMYSKFDELGNCP